MVKVTVCNKRKAVEVVSYGGAPLFLDDKGRVFPNGFTVRTKCNKKSWLASIRVTSNPFQGVEYRFVCESNPVDGAGDWFSTPTKAFQDASETKLRDLRYHPGTNGAVLIGVTYDNIQRVIKEHFKRELVRADMISTVEPSSASPAVEEEDYFHLALEPIDLFSPPRDEEETRKTPRLFSPDDEETRKTPRLSSPDDDDDDDEVGQDLLDELFQQHEEDDPF